MKKVILLYVMILISSIIYADEIRNVNGEARGFSNTSVIIKINFPLSYLATANLELSFLNRAPQGNDATNITKICTMT